MEQMIRDYQEVYNSLKERMAVLQQRLSTEELESRERDKIKGRIEVMKTERVELVHTIADMRKHL